MLRSGVGFSYQDALWECDAVPAVMSGHWRSALIKNAVVHSESANVGWARQEGEVDSSGYSTQCSLEP
jgi:hypothetical protein